MICLRSYDGRLRTQTPFSLIPKLKLFPLQEKTKVFIRSRSLVERDYDYYYEFHRDQGLPTQ